MNAERTTFIEPGYTKTGAGHKPIDGVQFYSYRTGIQQYCRISQDGQIITRSSPRLSTYSVNVIGHGFALNKAGAVRRFRSQDAAAREGVKIWKSRREIDAAPKIAPDTKRIDRDIEQILSENGIKDVIAALVRACAKGGMPGIERRLKKISDWMAPS